MELIRRLRELEIIFREPVLLKSGEVSDFYVDVKKAYGYPRIVTLIADALWEKMGKNTTCVAAMGYGGLPPATVLKETHGLKLTMVREEPKKHGRGGFIDGHVPTPEDRVALVDDVLTTGGSLKRMCSAIEPTGAEIVGAYVVVKRGDPDVGVPISYILKV